MIEPAGLANHLNIEFSQTVYVFLSPKFYCDKQAYLLGLFQTVLVFKPTKTRTNGLYFWKVCGKIDRLNYCDKFL